MDVHLHPNCIWDHLRGYLVLLKLIRKYSTLTFVFISLVAGPAYALESVMVSSNSTAADITELVEFREVEGNRLQLSITSGLDGIVHEIEVRSAHPRKENTNWMIFSLRNSTDKPVSRLLFIPFFHLAGSGFLSPDLWSQRIENISTDRGIAPERIPSRNADIYRITLNPMTDTTFIAELKTGTFPKVFLWEESSYEENVKSRSLAGGILFGIAFILALLSATTMIFSRSLGNPFYAALVSWSVLFYLCVDFDLLYTLFGISSGQESPYYRVASELMVASTILSFLSNYLDFTHRYTLNRKFTHLPFAVAVLVFLISGISLSLSAFFAHLFSATAMITGATILIRRLSNGSTQAIRLIPSWTAFVLFVATGAVTITGLINGDVTHYVLASALILLVLSVEFITIQDCLSSRSVEDEGGQESQQRAALAIRGAGDFIVWDWNVEDGSVWTSPNLEEKLGREKGDLKSLNNWVKYINVQDCDHFESILEQAVEKRKGRVFITFRMHSKTGDLYWFQLRARPVVSANGEILRCVGALTDITDVKMAEEGLLQRAVHDNLTGLPNRQLFMDRIASFVSRMSEVNTESMFVIIVDLDKFKLLNDRLGVSAGDTTLMIAARRISRCLRQKDSLARIGGNQFGIVSSSDEDDGYAMQLIKKIQKVLEEPIILQSDRIIITSSIGITTYEPGSQKREDALITEAELASIHAKRLGGNRSEVFRPTLRKYYIDSHTLENDLRSAVQNNAIGVVFQPIIYAPEESIAGFEALARWEHPKCGLVQTKDFIEIAERCNLILDIDLLVLEQTLQSLALWQKVQGVPEDLFVSVNFSGKQFLNFHFVDQIKSLASKCSVNLRRLQLEITESFMFDHSEHTVRIINDIREIGAKVSLDDFGTGYSSLSHLKSFAFDTIKIDQRFIRDNGKAGRVIRSSLINLAHNLGMQVIAEGVETDAQLADLRELGCDFVQGYLYGQPMPANETKAFLVSAIQNLQTGTHA